MVTVQALLAGIVPPENTSEFPSGTVITVPLGQVVTPLEVLFKPAGNWSMKVASVSGRLFAFDNVIVSVDRPPEVMALGENVLITRGGVSAVGLGVGVLLGVQVGV